MKAVVLSDTHNQHRKIALPKGDILIHCGDFTLNGEENECLNFLKWLGEVEGEYAKVFIIPGNHDAYFTSASRLLYQDALKKYTKNTVDLWLETYLKNQIYMFDGYSFFGFPHTHFHRHMNDFFTTVERHNALVENILNCNILVSHGPPYGYLDAGGRNMDNLGSKKLKDKITSMSDLKLMTFGHIHEQGGKITRYKDIQLVNAAVLDYPDYKLVGKPLEITVE
jgi:Icc-related predicted phosphoesterase